MDGERAGVAPESTLGARMREARRERFVGRDAELALMREALSSPAAGFAVLFVHGPGGVGKTTLLDRFTEIAADAGAPVVRVDLGLIEPSPEAVLAELAANLGLAANAVLDALGDSTRRVLLLDTYESAAPIDAWVRQELLPALGVGTFVVLAGRQTPSRGWLADPGLRSTARLVSLRNLAPADARTYLRAEGMPPEVQDHAITLSHGHPLALSLLAELVSQRTAAGDALLPGGLGDAPDLVRTLLESLLDRVPSETHRQALNVCALARSTSEDLLRDALGLDDAADLFAWLRDLSFVERGPQGIFPHDLARDVLEADLRWRDRDGYRELHRRVYAQLARRARTSDGHERQRALMDWNFLLRTNPFAAAFLEWQSYGSVYYDRLRAADRGPMLEIARQHEGAESAALVAFWLERQPDAFRVLRAGGREPVGFGAVLALHEADQAEIARDPGTAAMWSYAQRHGAPRPGEEVYASRFYLDRDTYQGPSASYDAIIAAWIEKLLGRVRPAWEFLGFWADADRIEPFMAYIDFHRAPEADFTVGGRRYGVFAHDWRRMGLDDWFDLAARRQSESGFDAAAAAAGPPPAVALSAPDFGAAAHRALRDLHHPAALARNPLLASRLVRDRTDVEQVAALRAVLEDAVRSLRDDPRDAKPYRALDRTYLRPAPSQELAAETLGLPLSTYKRHLRRGVEQVVAWLWERELYGDSV